MKYENGEPVWRDGDVVKVEFAKKDGTTNGIIYTYERIDGYWPGDQSWSTHGDDVMTAAWHDSRLAAMQAVGASFVREDDPAAPLAEPYDLVRLRILERAVNNVRDIIESTGLDRPLSSFIDEIRAVLS